MAEDERPRPPNMPHFLTAALAITMADKHQIHQKPARGWERFQDERPCHPLHTLDCSGAFLQHLAKTYAPAMPPFFNTALTMILADKHQIHQKPARGWEMDENERPCPPSRAPDCSRALLQHLV